MSTRSDYYEFGYQERCHLGDCVGDDYLHCLYGGGLVHERCGLYFDHDSDYDIAPVQGAVGLNFVANIDSLLRSDDISPLDWKQN